MSIRPRECEKCHGECQYLGNQLFAVDGAQISYGVGWGCSQCDFKALDVCPLGPVFPTTALCLNCGMPYPSSAEDAACADCGLTRAAALDFLRLTPVPPANPGAVARDLFGKGLFRRGLAVLNQALSADPTLETPWLLKCTLLEGFGLFDPMIEMLESALAAGAPAALLINYGSVLHRIGRFQDAAAAARRYLELEPHGRWAVAARTNLGVSLRKLGRDDDAEALYREAIQMDPEQVVHYRNLGQLLVDQKRWAGALGALETGLARATKPEDRIRFLEGLAFVSIEEERASQALASLERAMSLGADSANTHYLKSQALALLGRLEEAGKEIDLVLQREPGHEKGKKARAMIEQATQEQKQKER
jgi:tetratricopeptide (TPR) repeat protein